MVVALEEVVVVDCWRIWSDVPGHPLAGSSFPVSTSPGSYTVTIGGGGIQDLAGSNSVFGSITSAGGGREVDIQEVAGGNGGSGGGGHGTQTQEDLEILHHHLHHKEMMVEMVQTSVVAAEAAVVVPVPLVLVSGTAGGNGGAELPVYRNDHC